MHPGSGGNPGFNMYDLDSKMRMVFIPPVPVDFVRGLDRDAAHPVRIAEEKLNELDDEKIIKTVLT